MLDLCNEVLYRVHPTRRGFEHGQFWKHSRAAWTLSMACLTSHECVLELDSHQ